MKFSFRSDLIYATSQRLGCNILRLLILRELSFESTKIVFKLKKKVNEVVFNYPFVVWLEIASIRHNFIENLELILAGLHNFFKIYFLCFSYNINPWFRRTRCWKCVFHMDFGFFKDIWIYIFTNDMDMWKRNEISELRWGERVLMWSAFFDRSKEFDLTVYLLDIQLDTILL